MTGPVEARGLIVDSYGDWRNVRLGAVRVPPPGPGEVLIEAQAASLNFPDMLMIAGRYQHRPEPPFTPGRDVAGTVVAVGPGVDGVRPGQRVAAQPPHGAFATYVVAPESFTVRLPDEVSFVDAAAAGTVLATVAAALGLRGRPRLGELVLITGAAGGVGSAGVQYARMMGARVAAVVSSAAKEAAVRALGAEIVLRTDAMANLRDGLRDALRPHAPGGVDVAIDMVGGDTFDGVLRCLRPGGRCVVVGFASGRIPTVATNYLLLKDLVLMGSSLDRMFRSGDETFRTLLTEAFAALAAGRLRIPVDGCYALDDFPAAMERLAGRGVIGKVVLSPLR